MLSLIVSGVANTVLAQEQSVTNSLIAQGARVFKKNCAECHSYGYGTDGAKVKPAVAALQIKYKGALSPYLEERSDLAAPILEVFIRNGIVSMTPFRKTEVSDKDITAIAAYLKNSASNKVK